MSRTRLDSSHPIVTLDAILDLGMQSPIRRRQRLPHRPVFETAPPEFGQRSLAVFGIADSWPHEQSAERDSHLFILRGVRIHSSAGIVITEDGQAIAETLRHTSPRHDGYRLQGPDRDGSGRIALPGPAGRLQGTWLSLLLGGTGNHFGVVMRNLARVAALDRDLLAGLDGVLLPADFSRVHRDAADVMLRLAFGPQGAPEGLKLRHVAPGEGIDVERLVLLWESSGDDWVNPLAIDLLRPLALPGAPAPGTGRMIYIDRRHLKARPLLNEDELVTSLQRLDIEPVRLETLGFREQIAVVSESRLIVGAHGTGLTDLVFASYGAVLFEIKPHGLQSWRYRSLAAAAGLQYDFILSRSLPQADADPADQAAVVEIDRVLEAIDDHLAKHRAAAWFERHGR